jgi:glutathione S-transferase
MATYRLIIGNKNYSSWSLRGWLAVKQAGVAFEEDLVDLAAPDYKAELRRRSPAAKVPVLQQGELLIWDSLAIIEHLAESHPEAGFWPAAPAARAMARSIAAEMHAGFAALRSHMPMNIRARHPGKGMGPGVAEDIRRIAALWQEARDTFGRDGAYLFGPWSAADSMYAPVASRFRTYGVALAPDLQAYVDAIHDHEWLREWERAALEEHSVIAEDEIAEDGDP